MLSKMGDSHESNFRKKVAMARLGMLVAATAAWPHRVVFKAVWSAQVTGKALNRPSGTLDLVNFERHQARAQLVKSF